MPETTHPMVQEANNIHDQLEGILFKIREKGYFSTALEVYDAMQSVADLTKKIEAMTTPPTSCPLPPPSSSSLSGAPMMALTLGMR
jgi:hypothetical protein